MQHILRSILKPPVVSILMFLRKKTGLLRSSRPILSLAKNNPVRIQKGLRRAKAKARARAVKVEKVKEQVRQEEGHPQGRLPKEGASFAMESIGCPSVPKRIPVSYTHLTLPTILLV